MKFLPLIFLGYVSFLGGYSLVFWLTSKSHQAETVQMYFDREQLSLLEQSGYRRVSSMGFLLVNSGLVGVHFCGVGFLIMSIVFAY